MLSFTKTLMSTLLFGICSGALSAQTNIAEQAEGGGEYPIRRNDTQHPCISPQQYADIEMRIAGNIKTLRSPGEKMKTTTTAFSWPLQAAPGLADCGYYCIFNYVDEDATSPGIRDYNCGSVTYDGHRGTDIATQPYPFLKMDNNQVNVIAAAPGTIIQKSDGFFDRNCAMNSDTANYIIIQHADGSVALYWHMKKASLTSKTVGMSVTTGEFLGVVGSSGSSTAPHLHFEVWSGTTSSTLRDPWTGTCNLLNPTSWWAAQKPYTEPAIIKAQVNMAAAILPGCDTTETPNEDSCFVGGATAKFYIFIRNETPGDTVHESIINPGGSTFTSWVHNSTTSYLASYWWFNKVLPTTPGIYTFRATYNGITCDKTFKINCGALGVEAEPGRSSLVLYPDPAQNELTVAWDNKITKVVICDLSGRIVCSQSYDAEQVVVNVSSLPKGVYILQVPDATTGLRVSRMFVKE